MPGFSVTYAIYTEESIEQGDAAETDFLGTDLDLRDAIRLVGGTRTNRVDGADVHANESPVVAPRWITVSNGMEFDTGDYEERSLHIPEHVTPATRRRIARLLGVRT